MMVTTLSRVAKANFVRPVWAALIIGLVAAGTAAADDPSKEFWPEIDTWWRVSPAWRLSLFVPISKNLDTHYREGNFILQGDYAWGNSDRLRKVRLPDEGRQQNVKTFLIRGGYLGGKSVDDEGQAYSEQTCLAELHVRTPLKGGILLSSRLRTDLRWLGRNADFPTRWRFRAWWKRRSPRGARRSSPT